MNILCKNQYTIRKVDADGNESEVARFHNVALQQFYNAVIGRYMGSNNQTPTSCIHSCWFGTGSREPSPSDTALESPLWTYGWNYSNCTAWSKYLDEDNHICHKYTFEIAADASHVGTVSEVGVEIIAGTGYLAMGLATRALILDSEGHPMTITKTDLEVLYVDVIFEFILQDTENFKWLPENYMNYASRSGSGWAPIFTLAVLDRIFFMGGCRDDGFNIRQASLSFTKSYSSNNHELIISGARLPQETIPNQRYIKAIGIGSNTNNNVMGIWKLPNADVIPPKELVGMGVGTGDGETTQFNAPIAEWMQNTEKVYVNDVLQVRGVDYECSNDANAPGLCECSILRNMECISGWMTAPQNVRTPILCYGPAVSGGYRTALWRESSPTIAFAFPENAVKAIRRLILKSFISYTSITSSSASYSTNWSGAVWTVEYSDDGETWTLAGTATIPSSNLTEFVFDELITARYWRFTISNKVKGILFAANADDSIMAYGDQKPITFASAPPDGAVIKMDAKVDCPMKNSNFIIDVNPTFSI